MGSGFRRKDGGGWWRRLRQLAGVRIPGGRGFRLSPERRWGVVAVSMATGGHMDIGEGTWVPAFAGKTVGGGGVVYGNWRAYRYREDVGSGFRRKDGGGWWRRLWQLAGVPIPGGRGFRLSPERRWGVATRTPKDFPVGMFCQWRT